MIFVILLLFECQKVQRWLVKQRTIFPSGAHEVLINVDKIDKEGRTAIHRAVKAKYRTVDSVYRELPDGSRYIVVRRKKGESGTVQFALFCLVLQNLSCLLAVFRRQ